MRVDEASKDNTWNFFRKIRAFLFRPLYSLREWVGRDKKQSRGRQKLPYKSEKKVDYGGFAVAVRPLSKEYFEAKERKKITNKE